MSNATASRQVPHHDHPAPLSRLFALLRLELSDLLVVLVYAVAIGLLTLATPVTVQALVNQVAFGTLLQPVVVLTLLVLVGLSSSGLLRALQSAVVELLQQRLFVSLALKVAARLPRLASAAAERAPGLANRFLDIATLQKSLATLLLEGPALLLQTLIGLILLAFYHPTLLAFDVLLLTALAVILFVLGFGGVRTSVAESKAKYAVADFLATVAAHPLVFRFGRGAAHAVEHTDALLCDYVAARRAHFRIVLRQLAASLVLQAVASAGLLGVGGALVIAGQLTLGQLVAAELIVSAVVAGFAKLGKQLESYYDLLAALDKVGHLLELEAEPESGAKLPPALSAAGLELNLVATTAGYPQGPSRLRGLDLRLAAGERAAIIGEVGSGRSLLAALAAGLVLPRDGRVELDGSDVRGLDLVALREQVLLLRLDPASLPGGTVVETLLGGHSDGDRMSCIAALSEVGLWPARELLPAGLDTPLGPGARELGRRAQLRLLVARALVCRPRLLVVDAPAEIGADELAGMLALLAAPTRPWTLLLTVPSLVADRALAGFRGQRFVLADGQLQAAGR